MFEIFQYPFMIRALIAGIFVSVLLGYLGVFITTRKMSFIGDGVAHASLLGVALALFFGWSPIPVAVFVSAIIAVIIYFIEKRANVSSDVAINIMFTTSMALGIILLSFYRGYQPELISYLFGNILAISPLDLLSIVVFGSIIFIVLIIFYRKIFFVTFDFTGAFLSGLKPWIYDLVLYVATAVAVVLSIKIVGIVLVSSLLVTPSAIAKLFSLSFKSFTILTLLFSFFPYVVGLVISYYLDLPSGAVIVLTGTFVFVLSFFSKKLFSFR